jgi:subtilisin-like proprotein convertase family protein
MPSRAHCAVLYVRALTFLVALLIGSEAEGFEAFPIREGGYTRLFELALDELEVATPQGTRAHVKIPAVADRKAMASELEQQAKIKGDAPRLVMYEMVRGERRGNPRFVTADVLVTLAPDAKPRSVIRTSGVSSWRLVDVSSRRWIVTANDAAAALDLSLRLREMVGVTRADPLLARKREKKFIPNDPLFTHQWHLLNTGQSGGTIGIDIKATNVWPFVSGAGVTIGIVDDGLDTLHPDLISNINNKLGWDFNFDDNDPSHSLPDDGHGTSCAGVAAATGDNGVGVTGVAPQATLVGLRLLSLDTTDADEAAALNWRNDAIDIKSNSWGPTDDGITLEGPGDLLAIALSNACMFGRGGLGTIITWAGGNGRQVGDNSNFDGTANSIYTIAVAAVGHRGRQADYSEPGANLLVCAPSAQDSNGRVGGIWTTDRQGPAGYSSGEYTDDFSGTSSATPLVSGVIALMLEANPLLGWRDVQEILMRSATRNDVADPGWRRNPAGLWFNHKYGGGMVNAYGAFRAAHTWTNLGPQIHISVEASGLNLVIPDNNPAGITHILNVTNDIRIEHTVLHVDISHDYRGDLHIELVSPGGMTSVLATARAHDDGVDLDWSFMSVHHWGESSLGVWQVNMSDRAAEDTGVLNSLTLQFFGSAMSSPSPPPISAIEVLVAADPAEGGTVTGGGFFQAGSTQTISAAASPGWQFNGWRDGNADNPRPIVVGADVFSFVASFTMPIHPGTGTFMETWKTGVKKVRGDYEQIYKGRFSLRGAYPMSDDGFSPDDLEQSATMHVSAGDFERVFSLDDTAVTFRARNNRGRATYVEHVAGKRVLMITLKWSHKRLMVMARSHDSFLLQETIRAEEYQNEFSGEVDVKAFLAGRISAEMQINHKIAKQDMPYQGRVFKKVLLKGDAEFDRLNIRLRGKKSLNGIQHGHMDMIF